MPIGIFHKCQSVTGSRNLAHKLGLVKSISIGQFLKAARERAGLSQQALAQEASIAATQVSRIESGQRLSPHFATIAKIADALDISLDEIAVACGLRSPSAQASLTTRRHHFARIKSDLSEISIRLEKLDLAVASVGKLVENEVRTR
jgi:transcriptional regulator with XRE-family HTH domain